MSRVSEKERKASEAIANITGVASAEISKINELWHDGTGTAICNGMAEIVNNAVNGCRRDNFTMQDIGCLEDLVEKARRDMNG